MISWIEPPGVVCSFGLQTNKFCAWSRPYPGKGCRLLVITTIGIFFPPMLPSPISFNLNSFSILRSIFGSGFAVQFPATSWAIALARISDTFFGSIFKFPYDMYVRNARPPVKRAKMPSWVVQPRRRKTKAAVNTPKAMLFCKTLL